MSDTLRINPPPLGDRHSKATLDDKREWREGLADAEARIERRETEMALLLEDSIEAKHRIERLETALAAVMEALAGGETTYPKELQPHHKHALCGHDTKRHLDRAAEVLDMTLVQLPDED